MKADGIDWFKNTKDPHQLNATYRLCLHPDSNKPSMAKIYKTIWEIWILPGYLMIFRNYCYVLGVIKIYWKKKLWYLARPTLLFMNEMIWFLRLTSN